MERLAAYLISDVAALPCWRERATWPIPVLRLNAISDAVLRRTLARLGDITDDLDRHIGVVAAGRMIKDFIATLELALLIQSETEGIRLFGLPPLAEFLRGDSAAMRFHREARGGKGIHEVAPISWAPLRSLARAATWSSWYRIPAAMLCPRAVAISHNALLREAACREQGAIGFRHAHNLVVAARCRRGALEPLSRAFGLAEALVSDWLPTAPELREPYVGRVRQAVVTAAQDTMRRVAADVLALRTARRLPSRIWCGTTGAYTSRLVCYEVRRRGGEVVNFDHGGVTGISQLPSATAFTELAISNRFVVGTGEWARLLERTDAPTLARAINRTEIGFAHGDPTFRRARANGTAKMSARPRVLYVGHPFRGFRQSALPDPPDTLYWDFQIRVVESLKRLPIDLVCKPHPEGIYVGQRNPLEELAPTSYRRFEEHLDDTDIFVFDAPTSTTFGEALCTDRPVILLDRGVYPINPALDPAIRERCRVVLARPDDRQAFAFDHHALADAVADAKAPVDPSYFRKLLAGESDPAHALD